MKSTYMYIVHVMCTWKIDKNVVLILMREILQKPISLCVHFTCTYTIKWYPGGVCSPFVLLINTISQTALAAVLLD